MAMQESQMKASDGIVLFTRAWLTEKPAKALVVLIHGVGEHSGRYFHVAKMLNDHGISVFSYDQRGHGKSEGLRGYIPSTRQFMDDITLAIQTARKLTDPKFPLFIYGHSMGALETIYYCLHNDLKLNGVICTGPSLDISTTSKAKQTIAKIIAPIMPKLTMASGLDVNALSHDPAVVKAYGEDPLVHHMVSASLGMFFIAGAQQVMAKADKWKYPLLLMHGTDDKLGLIAGSDEFMKKAKGDITYKRWEGLYHEIHNEPQKEQVFKMTLDWIDKHI